MIVTAAVVMVYFPNLDPLLATQRLIAGVQPIVLLAVPMFIFAADIMSVGQTSIACLTLWIPLWVTSMEVWRLQP